jgi:FkbM family methyltransferase
MHKKDVHYVFGRVRAVQRYNRDWLKYALCRYRRPDSVVRFRLRNGQNVETVSDAAFVLNEIYLDRTYDVQGVDWLKCHSILDLGANVGAFALYAASQAPNARIYCFEPASKAFRTLESNIASNRLFARAFKLAISDISGVGRLDFDNRSTARSLGDSGEEVRCINLADVFALAQVDRFDFVKMDVEGAELQILNGCTDNQLRRIGALAAEWHHSSEQLSAIVTRLRSIGFEAEGMNRYLRARLVD